MHLLCQKHQQKEMKGFVSPEMTQMMHLYLLIVSPEMTQKDLFLLLELAEIYSEQEIQEIQKVLKVQEVYEIQEFHQGN